MRACLLAARPQWELGQVEACLPHSDLLYSACMAQDVHALPFVSGLLELLHGNSKMHHECWHAVLLKDLVPNLSRFCLGFFGLLRGVDEQVITVGR